MNVRKVVAGSVLAAGLGVAGIVGAGAASADGTAVGSNPSLSDTNGYGVTNHMQGDGVHDSGSGWNGDANGIGAIRSAQTGAQVSAQSGTNRVVTADEHTLTWQQEDISKSGNKVAPGQTSKLAK
jgi:hypothetical protein